MLAKMGYKEIEMYGPYTFSSEKQKANWKSLEPLVGFSGSGFFGKSLSETKAILKDTALKVPSLHTDLDTLSELMGPLADAANELGSKYVVLPAIPEDKRKNIDDYKRMAERFNKIGAEAKANGIHFAYHNHGYGLSKMEGVIPLDIILNQTDPSLVYLEMDLFWTTAGGADPIQLLKANKGRYKLMHVKDMKKKVHFSGDGGNAKQWTELWGEMTTAGDGVLDLKNILSVAKENGLAHCIVEQDIVAHPEIALKKSYDYLASLKK
jgi:sugar phosphate isomerase/epimerase